MKNRYSVTKCKTDSGLFMYLLYCHFVPLLMGQLEIRQETERERRDDLQPWYQMCRGRVQNQKSIFYFAIFHVSKPVSILY